MSIKENVVEMTFDKAEKILKKYLKTFYENDYEKFTDDDFYYLLFYSVLQINKESELAKFCGFKKVDDYFNSENDKGLNRNRVLVIKESIQKIRNRFNSIKARDESAFEDSFVEFLEWWCDQSANGKMKCFYCEATEDEIRIAKETGRIIESDKASFNTFFHIDRIDSKDHHYNKTNCVFACVLCNNAKSDMIDAENFKDYFGTAMHNFWNGKKSGDNS